MAGPTPNNLHRLGDADQLRQCVAGELPAALDPAAVAEHQRESGVRLGFEFGLIPLPDGPARAPVAGLRHDGVGTAPACSWSRRAARHNATGSDRCCGSAPLTLRSLGASSSCHAVIFVASAQADKRGSLYAYIQVGLLQREIAIAINATPEYLGLIETGQRGLPLDGAARLAAVLQLEGKQFCRRALWEAHPTLHNVLYGYREPALPKPI